MIRDELSGVLPDRRFITIHPALLDIMSYHEAALIHEIRWRAHEGPNDDGWVTRSPESWRLWLCLTEKQLRAAVDTCVRHGWIEAEKRGGAWDHTRSFRLVVPQLHADLAAGDITPRGRRIRPQGQIDEPSEADDNGPQGQMTIAPEGGSHRSEELDEELVVPTSSSVPVTSDVSESAGTTPAGADCSSPTPTPAPPPRKGRSLDDLLSPRARGAKPAVAATNEPAAVAPSTTGDPTRQNRIKRPEALQRCLQPHGVTITSQADRRNLDKLAELGPTIAQLDGACNAMIGTEGHVDLGRLVAKWSSLVTEDIRPAGWTSPKRAERDKFDAHVAAGGNPYEYGTGAPDYGI